MLGRLIDSGYAGDPASKQKVFAPRFKRSLTNSALSHLLWPSCYGSFRHWKRCALPTKDNRPQCSWLRGTVSGSGERRTRAVHPSSGAPYWLHNFVDRFWIAAGELEPFPRRLEGPVSWALPLAIFKVPRLCVHDVERRLAEIGINFRVATPNRVLHGCLVAFAG